MPRSLFAVLHKRFGVPARERGSRAPSGGTGDAGENGGVTRREFLHASAAASAALLLSGRRARAGEAEGKRVIVLGAGLAGLACGYELAACGYNVTVIEARKRVGGRVQSINDWAGGKTVEAGGEFIGTNHPLWRAYANKFELGMADQADEELDSPVMIGGKILTHDEAEALHKELDAATAALNEDARDVHEDEPWKTPGAHRLDHRTLASWLEKLDASPLCKSALTVQLTTDLGVPLEKVSYLAMLTRIKGGGLERYWTDSQSDRVRGGNQKLAERLAAGLGADRVVTGAAVEVIDIAAHGVNIVTRDRRFDADDAVLALPPSVWSKLKITPGLPKEWTPQMGRSVKYLALSRDRFWAESKRAADSMSDGPVSMTWESTAGQAGAEGFVMSAQSGGASAEACRKGWAAQKDAFFKSELAKLYPGVAGALKDSKFVDWVSEPWTQAGASCAGPGQVTKLGPALASAHAEHLHFAGEHVCLKFAGTMEGALQSGVRVARRLAERDGMAWVGPTPEPATTEPAGK